MRKLVRPKSSLGVQAEHLWKTWQASVILGIICGGAALWAILWIPSPGVSIAILGCVAAIMSLRPESRLAEKAGWLVIVTVLLVAEVESIRKSERQNFNDRNDQIGRLVALTSSSKEISAKIELFAPKSIPVATLPQQAPNLASHKNPVHIETTPSPQRSAEDQRLIDQLKGIVAANKTWEMTRDQLIVLTRSMSAFAPSEERGDLVTALMNDPNSQKIGNQLVAAFRAAGWKLPGSGINLGIFGGQVVGIHIVVSSRDASPPGLGPFVQALRAAGIDSIGEIDPKQPPNQFRIIVGSAPEPTQP